MNRRVLTRDPNDWEAERKDLRLAGEIVREGLELGQHLYRHEIDQLEDHRERLAHFEAGLGNPEDRIAEIEQYREDDAPKAPSGKGA